MAISFVLTPVAIVLELAVFLMGVYAGYALKKRYGYLFGFTFFVFSLFDYFSSLGISADVLAVLNIIAILAAVGGMFFLIKETLPNTPRHTL